MLFILYVCTLVLTLDGIHKYVHACTFDMCSYSSSLLAIREELERSSQRSRSSEPHSLYHNYH